MTDNDYRRILEGSFKKFAELFQQREALDAELIKLRQLINATANMLPDDERVAFEKQLDALASNMGGLTDAVRDVLKLTATTGSRMTATEVRDHLAKAGFDFSRYTSNPLASVNTTLRRFKPEEVEVGQTEDGVTTYKWKAFGRSLGRFRHHGNKIVGRVDTEEEKIGTPLSIDNEIERSYKAKK